MRRAVALLLILKVNPLLTHAMVHLVYDSCGPVQAEDDAER